MRLQTGTRVGPYEILAPLGAGGMGEVYRARDPRLQREVAIKVLPAALADDAERLHRFEQEALAAAALQHPNLLAVYDVGQHDGSPYLVSELLAGESLRERLDRGPMPVRTTLELAAQIARGLAAAHERGIVHRDLKPDNVFLTRDGHAKILDFGLAKLTQVEPEDLASAPTQAATEMGAVLGTAGYMAPEQARGQVIDHRADLFAFGAVLYEMLAGRRAFTGTTATDALLAVLRDDPADLLAVRPEAPPQLARLVLHCLEKDPARRFQSARDLVFDLEELSGAAASTTATRAPAPAAAGRRWTGMAVAVIALLALAGVGWWAWQAFGGRTPAAPEISATRLAVFPFNVRGRPELAYLREGLVDLLSTKLDGSGELRAVDPHALLSAASQAGPNLDTAQSREVAERLGARLFLVGSLVEAGGQLRLAATLYDQEKEVAKAEAEGAGEGSLLGMVDELARRIVAERFVTPGTRIAKLGALTTESVPALKEYLAGERELRSGRMAAAAEAMQRAIAIDGEFALAHYRLAVAQSWAEDDPDVAIRSAEKALTLADQLSERDRQLLRALHAYVRGLRDEAEELYDEVVDNHPDELEAWYGLGEVQTHLNAVRGRAKWESEAAFRRAVDLDPDFQPALYHLAQAAAHQGKKEDLERWSSHLLALYPESDAADRVRAWRVFLLGSQAERDAFRSASVETPAGRGFWPVTFSVGLELRRLDDADAFFEAARQKPWLKPEAYHRWKLQLALARGQLSRARSEAEAVHRLSGDPIQELYLALPFLPVTRKDLLEARRVLAAWQPPSEWDWVEHKHQAPLLKTYGLGVADARLGDAEGAQRSIAALARFTEPRDEPLARALASTLRALLLAEAKRPEEALREIERIELPVAARLLNESSFYNLLDARLLRADLLFGLGRDEEAIVWYRSLDETCCFDNLLVAAYSHLRRGEALDRLGRREEAAWHYAQMLELWREPDAELAPLVERVRARLAGRERL